MRLRVKTLFDEPAAPVTSWRVICWWESRRIAYNLFVGVISTVCLIIFYWAIHSSGKLDTGEDAVEPMALIVALFLVNLSYTLGWMVEVSARWFRVDLSPLTGPKLLKAGLIFSIFIISLPAVVWTLVRVLQIIGLLE